jgi:hypothetical protein
MTTNNKTSLVVNKQLPGFIQDDYPLFVRFLEAYYEFLENLQTGENNDLITQAKNIRYIKDVDTSIDAFQDQFFNDFAALFPKDNNVDSAFLIKNVMPLYKAKGSANSFRYLFNLLYGKDIELLSPRNSILRASDGKWIVENVLRAIPTIYSQYTYTTSNTFYLAQQCLNSDIVVYKNDVQITTGFNTLKEYYKIVFDTGILTSGDVIKIYYNNFNSDLLTNREIKGTLSDAYAIIERAEYSYFKGQRCLEMIIIEKTKSGNFVTAELLNTNILAPDNQTLIQCYMSGLSVLEVSLTSGGASYNIGDPVTLSGGEFSTEAVVVVGDVYQGTIDNVSVVFGGAGFMTSDEILAPAVSNASFLAIVSNTDTSGANSANTLTVFTDIIANSASINIANTIYVNTSSGLPVFVGNATANMAATLANTLNSVTYTVGPISNAVLVISNVLFPTKPVLNAVANTSIHVPFIPLGILGRIDINNPGSNYAVGDEVIFTNHVGSVGLGAAGRVAAVNTSNTNSIVRVDFEPARITGTANTNGSIFVVGTGTAFNTELRVGDRIMINGESRYINSISSATRVNVNVSFSGTSTNKKVGKYGTYIIGGQGYANNNFPTISITSVSGTGANLTIRCLMGDGEQFDTSSATEPGQIKSLSVLSQGERYRYAPALDLTAKGDGTAKATASLLASYSVLKGRYRGSDGIISDNAIRIQEGNIYHDFSYLIKSKVQFDQYKQTLKTLAHPSGFSIFGRYLIDSNVSGNSSYSNVSVRKTIAGTVSVTNNSIYVTGTNTKFNIANSLGIISTGSTISVNNVIRVVANIINNTNISVTSAYTSNVSNVGIIVL